MFGKRKERIFLVELLDSQKRGDLLQMAKDLDPGSNAKVVGSTMIVYLKDRDYAVLLTHLDGDMRKGLVHVMDVHLGRTEWTYSDGKVVEA